LTEKDVANEFETDLVVDVQGFFSFVTDVLMDKKVYDYTFRQIFPLIEDYVKLIFGA
jgi:hypothetical protein